MEIHIANLLPATTQAQLAQLFAPFGTVQSSKIRTITDVSKSVMTTFAYIHMAEHAGGTAAITKLNKTTFLGKIITVTEAG